MIESVMVIPLLVGFIAATFFFAWILGNQQRLRSAERHLVWHGVRGGDWPSTTEINDRMLLGRASAINLQVSRGMEWVYMGGDTSGIDGRKLQPTDKCMTDLAEYVNNASALAGPMADDLLLRDSDHSFPRGKMVRMWVNFPSNVGAWTEVVKKPFEAHFAREGVEWRRGQAESLEVIADRYLDDVETTLESVPSPGNDLAQQFRDLYLVPW